MKLTSFRVRRYKNVLDSTEVSVESDVTTLVGTKESGKSTMLDPDRLLLRLEALDGKFDHGRPAEVLLRDPSRVERLSKTSLANFEALAKVINATHSD